MYYRHDLVTRHGDDVAFQVTVDHVPVTLVDAKGRKSVVPSVLVGFRDGPSRRVGDALQVPLVSSRDDC